MTTDLVEAYQGVYTSSKEIMKNKQRHLYINMLDLLTRTTKATCASSKNLITDDYVKFWYIEILPLVFDDDKTIQENAISALETVLSYFDISAVHNFPEWTTIKGTITETFSKKLHTLRNASNSNWYKIWCLLIRILDKEILKGATVINTFLSVVELGFRSNDYKTRAEAFICWKALVEIFAKHQELFSPKRIKLICIPLKSSQSKTPETAVNKFKVWWYFLCKLNTNIENYYETTFEPFLMFSFGPPDKSLTTTASTVKMYPAVKQMAIACLIEMLGPSTKETQCILETTGLERASCPFITKDLMIRSYKTIINAVFEATTMIIEQSQGRSKLLEILWRNLMTQIIKTNDYQIYLDCFKNIKDITNSEQFSTDNALQQCISQIIEWIGTHKDFPFEDRENVGEIEPLTQTYIQLLELLSNKYVQCSPSTIEGIIKNAFNMEQYKRLAKCWDIYKSFMESIMSFNYSINFDIRILIWKKISTDLASYLTERLFEFRIDSRAAVLNNWLFWPLINYGISNRNNDFIIDAFLNIWKNLALAACKAEGHDAFVKSAVKHLKDIFENNNRIPKFPEIMGIFINTLDTSFDNSSKPTAAFEFINHVLSKPPNNGEINDKILIALTKYVNSLGEDQIIDSFEDFKIIISTILQELNPNAYTKHAAEEFKKSFMEKLKSNKAKQKNLLREIKDLSKNNSNVFVIIPTVWTMNPDKLTEHQKEKMKEKRSDIPALYNDMSQSQDTLKPWTPNKIVIAKGKHAEEIVIENKDKSPKNVIENNVINNNIDDDDDNVEIIDFVKPHDVSNEDLNKSVESGKRDTPKKISPKIKSPVQTPIQTPINTPVKASVKTPVKTPTNTPIKTPVKTPVKTSPTETKSNSIDSSNTKEKEEAIQKRKADGSAKQNKNNENSNKKKKENDNKTNVKTKIELKKADELLKKFNISIDDENKKLVVLRQLKTMEIDTVEGNAFLNEKLRNTRKKRLTLKKNGTPSKVKQVSSAKNVKTTNEKVQNFKKTARKSLDFEIDDSSSDVSEIKSENSKNKESSDEKNSPVNVESEKKRKQQPADIENKKSETSTKIEKNSPINVESEKKRKQPPEDIENKKNETSTKKNDGANANQSAKKVMDDIIDITDDVIQSSQCSESIMPKKASFRKSLSHNRITTSNIKTVNEKLANQFQKTSAINKELDKSSVINKVIEKENENISNQGKVFVSPTKKRKFDTKDIDINKPINTNNEKLTKEQIISEMETQSNNSNNQNNIINLSPFTFESDSDENMPLQQYRIMRNSPKKSQCQPLNNNDNDQLDIDRNSEVTTTENNSLIILNQQQNKEISSSNDVSLIINESPSSSPVQCDSSKDNTSSKNILNRSTLSSPELKDAEERNAEFLNNTLNISPIEAKETGDGKSLSPSRNDVKIVSAPSSPPDRKSISNAESPIVKPKPISQLTGRGAQLINMIRNKKSETTTSKFQPSALISSKSDEKISPETAKQGQHPQATSPVNDQAAIVTAPVSGHKDLLIFSKVLPPPTASPSASILKRKLLRESFEEIESPASKRKRVSFHDPPVSVTKEYVKHVEEEKSVKVTKCLMPDKTSTPQPSSASKNPFKRKSRVDSMMEIAKFAETPTQASEADTTSGNSNPASVSAAMEMETLKWNATDNSHDQRQSDDDGSLTPSPTYYFPDEPAILNHIFEKYSFEDILEKYLNAGKQLTAKSVRAVTKSISTNMNQDSKLKTNVLEMLSEMHPKEFLDHAIQENLSSVVCDRLNANSVVEYVCDKSKINTGMRKLLLDRVQSMLATEKLSAERYEFVKSLIKGSTLSNEEALECIQVIINQRQHNNTDPPVNSTTPT